MEFSKLKKTGACESDLWEFGFEGKKVYDPDEDENYYKLFLNGEEVGYTEIHEVTGDIEIICDHEEKYDEVVKIVGDKVIVWAWYCSREDRLINRN